MRERRQQRGASFLEFIMVAPVMLLVAGATVELSRFIRFRQVADVLSKEAAMRAYRQCDITKVKFESSSPSVSKAPTVDEDQSATDIQNCLNTTSNNIQNTLAQAGITGSVILSMYRFEFNQLVPTPACTGQTPRKIISQNSTSVYNPTVNGISGPNGTVTGRWGCTTGRVVISEVAFRYTPIINYRVIGVGNSFDVNFRNSQLSSPNAEGFREATIL